MGDGEPSLSGLAKVGANFIEGLALGVTAWKRRDGGGISARLKFGDDNCGEGNGDIDDDRQCRHSGRAHGRVHPFLLLPDETAGSCKTSLDPRLGR